MQRCLDGAGVAMLDGKGLGGEQGYAQTTRGEADRLDPLSFVALARQRASAKATSTACRRGGPAVQLPVAYVLISTGSPTPTCLTNPSTSLGGGAIGMSVEKVIWVVSTNPSPSITSR